MMLVEMECFVGSLLIIKKELLPGSGSFLTSMQLLASNSLKKQIYS